MLKRLFLLGVICSFLVLPAAALADALTPGAFSATIAVGETVTVTKTITLDPGDVGLDKVDVFFLSDNTGSMFGVIDNVQSAATDILAGLGGADPRFLGTDVGFGVGRYLGDPLESGETPTTAYQLQQSITTSGAAAQTGIDNWFASGGGDLPEANFFALHQVATEGGSTDGIGSTDPGIATGQVTGWRDGAGRVIVWFGDVPSHTTTVDQAEAIAALTGNAVTVAALNSVGAGSGIDTSGQASAIVAATGGTLTNNLESASPDATLDAIFAAVESATESIDLTFLFSGDTSGLGIDFTPILNVTRDPVDPLTFDIDLSFTGLAPGTYDFTTFIPGLSDTVEEDLIVVTGEAVPEPATMMLLGSGLLGLALFRRRK